MLLWNDPFGFLASLFRLAAIIFLRPSLYGVHRGLGADPTDLFHQLFGI
jgi:hypothetical protein